MKKNFHKLFVLAVMLAVAMGAKAQTIINTYAGNGFGGGTLFGTGGYSGDGGAATAAELTFPQGVTTDAAGNVYIADFKNNVIRKVNPAGIISTIAGTGAAGYSGDGGPATAATLFLPSCMKLDASGNMYIADLGNNVVRKINTAGMISTIAGNGDFDYLGDGGPAINAAICPNNLAIDPAGNLYIADYDFSNTVRKVDAATGIINTIAGNSLFDFDGYSGDGGPATAAELDGPAGIALDALGNLYIADEFNDVIREVNTAGIISTFAGFNEGLIFGLGYSLGYGGYGGDGGQATNAFLNQPGDVAVDEAGNVLIVDYFNNVIRKVNTSGIISTIAGNAFGAGDNLGGYTGDGGLAANAEFFGPGAISTDPSGKVYVVDSKNNVVRVLSQNHLPSFTSNTTALTVCENGTGIVNPLMDVLDSDVKEAEIWSVTTPPAHGALDGFNAISPSTGGIVTPDAFLTYTPATGYTGMDSFSVQISDDGFDSVLTTVHIMVNPLPVAGTITGPHTVCPGAHITLADAAAGGIWSSSNASAAIAGAGEVLGISAATDTISYTVINGCGEISATAVVTVNPLPAAGTITGANSVITGTTITLTDAATGGVWSTSNSHTTVTGGVVTGISTGASTVSYKVTNSCGTAVATKGITVNAPITGATSVCKGAATTLSNATGGGTWSSSNAGIAAAGITSGIVTGAAAGTATITYTVAGNHITTTVTVYPVPAITVSAGAILCHGGETTVTVSGTGGTGILTGTGTATVAAGVFHFTITDIKGCPAATSVTITQPAALTAGITVSPVTPVPGAAAYTIYLGYGPSSVTLNSSAAGGTAGYHYSWAPVAGSGASVTVSPTATTTYNVTVTDAHGCMATSARAINVIDARSHHGEDVDMCHNGSTVMVAPGAVPADLEHGYSLGPCHTAGRSAGSDTTGPGTSVTDAEADAIKVYPNPNHGSFTVMLSSVADESVHITVTDMLGQKVSEYTSATNTAFDIKMNKAAGIYFVSAATAHGSYTTKVTVN